MVEDDRALRRKVGSAPVWNLSCSSESFSGSSARRSSSSVASTSGIERPIGDPWATMATLADLLDAVLRDVVVEDPDEALEADDVMRDVLGVERLEEEAGRAAIARRIGRHEVEDVVADARSLRERVIQ